MQRTYPAGVTSWVDVEVDDVAAARAFYGGLFGWASTTMTPPSAPDAYAVASLEGQEVLGICGPTSPTGATAPRWNTYVAVDRLEHTLHLVERAGGKVLDPPAQAGEAGRWASFADPEGTRLCLWQAGHRLGAQVTNAPGAWNFSDLHATDPLAVRAFYAQVFGWVFADLGFGTMIQVPGYGDHLASTVDPGIHERQAAIDAPAGFADAIAWLRQAGPGTEPAWQVSLTVADRDETAALVASLGGQVLSTEDTEWTRTALIRDPGGAESVISQFTPPQ